MAAPGLVDLLLQLALLLVVGKVAGEAAGRLGQPPVLGELLGGILLGPSLVGGLLGAPPYLAFDNEVIRFIAEVGILVLLLEVGLEADVQAILRVGGVAAAVAAVGVALPFLFGWALFAAAGAAPLVALFLGATMTATSVGITARVLADLGRLQSPEAHVVLGAAVFDDVIGLVLLSALAGVATGAGVQPGAIALLIVLALAFIVPAFAAGHYLGGLLLGAVDRTRVRGMATATVFIAALLLGALAQLLGLAALLGGFAAGALFARTGGRGRLREGVGPLADVFAPVFFVFIGSLVDLRLLLAPGVALLVLLLIPLAIVGKLAAGLPVPRGRARRLPVGVGMVPRGEVGLIFAGFGLTHGIFDGATYAAAVLVVMATTLLAPPALKAAFARVPRGAPAPPPAPAPGTATPLEEGPSEPAAPGGRETDN